MSTKLPDIKTQFSEWYNEVVFKSELADHAPVRGCMVIRPYGYALWENIKEILDKRIKETGHQNAAFPLLIPKSFIEKEKQHVAGFSPELAVVTIAGGKELEEPLVIRPTSETIIHSMFAQWIKSWRDLPMKINQWANVVRWEMRTRPFLRTTEFWWQEGHTAHETAQEAKDEAEQMWREYINLYQDYLAIPVVFGMKSESEKFAGADATYTVEGIMRDGKALQLCTSHIISQNFAKSFGIMFQDRQGNQAYPYLTSWGFTTRSIGAVIMVHGDEKGLVIPPKIAPIQIVIVPIFRKDADTQIIKDETNKIAKKLIGHGYSVHVDDREDETPGAKFYKWELKGVPMRIEIGPRDVANGTVMLSDRLGLAKEAVPMATVEKAVEGRTLLLQKTMFDRANERQSALWHTGKKLTQFGPLLEADNGFYKTGWCGKPECEAQLKHYKATIRCLLQTHEFEYCFNCDLKSKTDTVVAKSY
ncbi:MAG TPA: proline--tRNA ligase [Candidatus Babeliales bacterium]|nr:proline--tRNA ligase [Candidatus Babeliales bacterium]